MLMCIFRHLPRMFGFLFCCSQLSLHKSRRARIRIARQRIAGLPGLDDVARRADYPTSGTKVPDAPLALWARRAAGRPRHRLRRELELLRGICIPGKCKRSRRQCRHDGDRRVFAQHGVSPSSSRWTSRDLQIDIEPALNGTFRSCSCLFRRSTIDCSTGQAGHRRANRETQRSAASNKAGAARSCVLRGSPSTDSGSRLMKRTVAGRLLPSSSFLGASPLRRPLILPRSWKDHVLAEVAGGGIAGRQRVRGICGEGRGCRPRARRSGRTAQRADRAVRPASGPTGSEPEADSVP